MYIYTMHKYDETHLAKVMEEAAKVGSVKLNTFRDGEVYYILDGVHRTEAAKRLKLPLILVLRSEVEMITDIFQYPPEDATVAEIIGNARISGTHYEFADFVSVKVIGPTALL
jgi:hypothetical protein